MLLEIEDLSKSYVDASGPLQVLDGLSLSLDSGETLALTGESGSGKSTLLHLIGGLDTADSGQLLLDGIEMTGLSDPERAAMRRGTVGIVFQQFNLVPSLTVQSNIAFQAQLGGHYDADWAREVTQRLGLDAQTDKYPEALSGGQQQRAAIARTLVARPKLVLADEPTGNLDEANAELVLDLMLELAREAGTAVLMVTHSTHHAGRLQRQLHLSRGKIMS